MSLPSVGAHAPRVGGHALCRSDLHAKSLGEGGEFLSYVWFIISLMGVKTLSDKLQMPDKEEGDDDPKPPEQGLLDLEEWRRMSRLLQEEMIWGGDRAF